MTPTKDTKSKNNVEKKLTCKEEIIDFIYNLIFILVIIAALRIFVVSPFEVDGASMRDTLYDRDYIIIDKLTYNFADPQRGDIVVVEPPQLKTKGLFKVGGIFSKHTFFVKRIIGMPGDTVEFKEGKVYINDALLDESDYLSQHRTTSLSLSAPHVITIPEDSYFIMGDNRDHSTDSRSWLTEPAFKNTINEFGALPEEDIIGKVRLVIFNLNQPFKRFKKLDDPTYTK